MKIEGMSTEANVPVLIDELETQALFLSWAGSVMKLIEIAAEHGNHNNDIAGAAKLVGYTLYDAEDILRSAAKGERCYRAPKAEGVA